MSRRPRTKTETVESKLGVSPDVFLLENLRLKKTPDPQVHLQRSARTKGRVTGMGIMQFWVTLFEGNELLPKSKKMTDAEIKRQVISEFPDRPVCKKLAAGKLTVNQYRKYYNRGKLTNEKIPAIRSRRYSITGDPADPRTGHPLNPETGEVVYPSKDTRRKKKRPTL